jgi:hypothetical protein
VVTVDIVDKSGRLLEAVGGEEGLITDPTPAEVQFANPPGREREVRVEWVSPGGCKEHYGMTIDDSVGTITVHSSYVEGGDSIGGNCGITLSFASPVAASGLRGVLQNTPPVFGVGALDVNGVARVVATDGLRVRSAPGTGADSTRLEPLLPGGARLRVIGGPVVADGYAWYRVAPCGGQPPYPSGWVAVASRLGESWVQQDSAAPCADGPVASVSQLNAPSCPDGMINMGDIDRFTGPTMGVVDALRQDFEGLLASDTFVLGSYEGRNSVGVIRAGRTVFVGSYGQDSHVYQYTACQAAGIKVRGT